MKVFGKSLHKSLKNEEKRPEASQMDIYGYKKDKKREILVTLYFDGI